MRYSALMTIASAIVEKYVDLESEFGDPSQPQSASISCSKLDYSKEVISLGLLYLNFKDAVRERDGDARLPDCYALVSISVLFVGTLRYWS